MEKVLGTNRHNRYIYIADLYENLYNYKTKYTSC